jgi:hypothetical protein
MPISESKVKRNSPKVHFHKKEVKKVGEPPLLGKETGGAAGKKEGPSCRFI